MSEKMICTCTMSPEVLSLSQKLMSAQMKGEKSCEKAIIKTIGNTTFACDSKDNIIGFILDADSTIGSKEYVFSSIEDMNSELVTFGIECVDKVDNDEGYNEQETDFSEYEEFDPLSVPDSISSPHDWGLKNFFGIDLLESPNRDWEYNGLDTSITGEKKEMYECFINGGGKNFEHFFDHCTLSVIGNRRTCIEFDSVFDRDSLSRDIPFCIMRDGMYDGNYKYNDFLRDFASEFYDDEIEKEWKRDEYTFKYRKHDDEISVTVFIDKVYNDRPDYDGCKTKPFTPDRGRLMEYFTPLLSSAVSAGDLLGFVAGTSDSVDFEEKFMFEPVGIETLSSETKDVMKNLKKGCKLKLKNSNENDDEEVLVTSLDEKYVFGKVPMFLDTPVYNLNKFGFIKSVTVLYVKKNIGVKVEFGED